MSAHVSGGGTIFKKFLIKVLAISGNSFFWLKTKDFYELGAHAKFHDPTTTTSGRIVTAGEEEIFVYQ